MNAVFEVFILYGSRVTTEFYKLIENSQKHDTTK